MALITIDEAKADLRITDTSSDADITLKMDIATGIVVTYCKATTDTWSVDTVPDVVKGVILLVTRNLFNGDTDVFPAVYQAILDNGFRDPTISAPPRHRHHHSS